MRVNSSRRSAFPPFLCTPTTIHDRQHNERAHSINELIFSPFSVLFVFQPPSLLSLFKAKVSLNFLPFFTLYLSFSVCRSGRPSHSPPVFIPPSLFLSQPPFHPSILPLFFDSPRAITGGFNSPAE